MKNCCLLNWQFLAVTHLLAVTGLLELVFIFSQVCRANQRLPGMASASWANPQDCEEIRPEMVVIRLFVIAGVVGIDKIFVNQWECSVISLNHVFLNYLPPTKSEPGLDSPRPSPLTNRNSIRVSIVCHCLDRTDSSSSFLSLPSPAP